MCDHSEGEGRVAGCVTLVRKEGGWGCDPSEGEGRVAGSVIIVRGRRVTRDV